MTKNELMSIIQSIINLRFAAGDESALESIYIYPSWKSGIAYEVDERIRYEDNLYRCVQTHTSLDNWTPDSTPALWVRVSVEEYPDWVQPAGAHDAYQIGAKVTYNGQKYVCTIASNIYPPNVTGWELV